MRVDFPAPLSPNTTRTSPERTVKEASVKARTCPNHLDKPIALMTMSASDGSSISASPFRTLCPTIASLTDSAASDEAHQGLHQIRKPPLLPAPASTTHH